MDSAAMAAKSDPDQNHQFRRPWTPPPKRKGPSHHTRASFGKLNLNSERIDSTATQAAKRAVCKAERRAAELDHRAVLLGAVGLRDAGLRDRTLAEAIRLAVLA
jgi:hypothetical protein